MGAGKRAAADTTRPTYDVNKQNCSDPKPRLFRRGAGNQVKEGRGRGDRGWAFDCSRNHIRSGDLGNSEKLTFGIERDKLDRLE